MLSTNSSLTSHTYVYKQDLTLNNPQELICHKTQTKPKNILKADVIKILIQIIIIIEIIIASIKRSVVTNHNLKKKVQ